MLQPELNRWNRRTKEILSKCYTNFVVDVMEHTEKESVDYRGGHECVGMTCSYEERVVSHKENKT